MPPRTGSLALALALAFATLPATAVTARADEGAADPTLNTATTRRSGLVLGTSLGVGVAGASGYPNNANFIDNGNFFSSSGFMFGRAYEFMLMGALSDYLNFGLWFQTSSYENSDWRSNGYGLGFRVEAFPLVGAVPALRDLGVFGHFGLGHATLDAKAPGYPSDDGTQSFLGAGIFHEWCLLRILGGHFALGPSLEYDDIYSRSIDRHGLLATVRLVFYGGK
jgi:hypothetical protein